MSAQSAERDDPRKSLEHDSEEMGERLESLEEHIDESKDKAVKRREDADPEGAAGDWEESEEATRGDDPSAFDDPENVEDDEDY